MDKESKTIKKDSGYQYVIVMSIISSRNSEKEELSQYNHNKFLMTVESKIRSLLVHLDSILNPVK